ncbi:hypothetical protein LOAG_03966 [Loa loa]|uniref:Uncharacterized protein n=1 Tax=Loa loa TaxID=7209 RepID=A0A1S0U3N7_LOALO|nr:hypothetical protein LOAG_03966 [Loa loa]EFO24517.1 hypothetical protein LOAG_03966 [Loa loa]
MMKKREQGDSWQVSRKHVGYVRGSAALFDGICINKVNRSDRRAKQLLLHKRHLPLVKPYFTRKLSLVIAGCCCAAAILGIPCGARWHAPSVHDNLPGVVFSWRIVTLFC